MSPGTTEPRPAAEAVPTEELEALRAPLTRYCYRLLGSAADTDDAVQETIIRAARNADRYDPARARLTTWVHRIATNICIDMLRGARRRALPVEMGPAADGGDIGAPLPSQFWVDPMPDRALFGTADPGDVVLERESVRLAFIALLQRLAPRQRAVLVLRDILAFSAKETAEALETTVASVNSALQRARAALEADRPEPADVLDPDDPEQRELLRRYVAAFQTHDLAEMTALLREDATTSMPPFAWWMRGGERIASLMTSSEACAGDRLVPTALNGAPGFGQYRPDESGRLRPFAVILVEPRGDRIAQIVTFLGTAERFEEFGLPASLDR
ncbi:RNA polymerase subunit sigma-70 [Glycomyces salinus]|uniref:RNA polymerase subunit sigma-70 n=1 Tax=Glycomyces salinus TaxID=980294 RepID=UPI0018ECFD54|nr:RNA polymerase subunit sigma-70 [Glycomyces salinus]